MSTPIGLLHSYDKSHFEMRTKTKNGVKRRTIKETKPDGKLDQDEIRDAIVDLWRKGDRSSNVAEKAQNDTLQEILQQYLDRMKSGEIKSASIGEITADYHSRMANNNTASQSGSTPVNYQTSAQYQKSMALNTLQEAMPGNYWLSSQEMATATSTLLEKANQAGNTEEKLRYSQMANVMGSLRLQAENGSRQGFSVDEIANEYVTRFPQATAVTPAPVATAQPVPAGTTVVNNYYVAPGAQLNTVA